MQLFSQRIPGHYNGKECFVHARVGALNEKDWVMTMQTLDVCGADFFGDICVSKSTDGGRTWTAPAPDSAFSVPSTKEGYRSVCNDAYPLYHRHTGRLLCTGAVTRYANEKYPTWYSENAMFYAVYDEKAGKYSPIRYLSVPDPLPNTRYSTGCAQFMEDENGDLLIPITISTQGESIWSGVYRVAVLRCAFDGETVTVKERSNILSHPEERGLVEPQLCRYHGKYLLSLRNDNCALYSIGDDDLHFDEPQLWRWDTDEPLPSYNTQQHWLQCGGKLYLVYTRKAGNNDHVFRHRAPLFMAQVDDSTMRILRHTEQVVAPERGARLGNFGVFQINDDHAVICVSEWMQPLGCERFGSDNSIFLTEVMEK